MRPAKRPSLARPEPAVGDPARPEPAVGDPAGAEPAVGDPAGPSPVDGADRLLGAVVRLLPAGRHDWGRAMRAELAGIEAPAARRGFAIGCARAAFAQPAVWRSIGSGLVLGATAALALFLAGGLHYLSVRVEMSVLVVMLVGLAVAGRRRGALGPVGAARSSRLIRSGTYLVLGVIVLSNLVDMRRYPGNPNGEAITLVLVIAILMAFQATILAATAQLSPVPHRTVTIGIAAGIVGALAWFVPSMMRPVFSVSLGVPLLVALGTGVVATLLALSREPATPAHTVRRAASRAPARRRAPLAAGLAAGLAGAATALMLISLLATGAMELFTSHVPDIVGPVMVPGSTAAQKLHEDMIEVGDTYFGVHVFGGIGFAALGLLIAASRARLVAWLLPAVAGVVLVAIGLSSRWPVSIFTGAAGVGVATIGIVLAGRLGRSPEPATPVDPEPVAAG